MSKCSKRNYHKWDGNLFSLFEDENTMTVTAECEDCGATYEAKGEWTQ